MPANRGADMCQHNGLICQHGSKHNMMKSSSQLDTIARYGWNCSWSEARHPPSQRLVWRQEDAAVSPDVPKPAQPPTLSTRSRQLPCTKNVGANCCKTGMGKTSAWALHSPQQDASPTTTVFTAHLTGESNLSRSAAACLRNQHNLDGPSAA